MSLRFGYLLNDAVAKNPAHPLVVFLGMNMPFEISLIPKEFMPDSILARNNLLISS